MSLLLPLTGAQALTLKESVGHTLATNPEVMAARHELDSREQQVRQAKAGYRPTLDVAAGIGREETRSPNTGDERVRLTRHESSLQLRQMVFDGFATQEEVRRQRARVGSADFRLQALEERTALRVAEVYINLLRQRDLLILAQDTLAEHRKIHNQMVLRESSGVGSKADLDQISARLALSQSNLIAAENNLQDAKTNFYRVVELVPDMADLAVPGIGSPMAPNLTDAEALAVKNHPTLLSANADIDAAQAQYQASRSAFYPRLQIEADKHWDEDIDGLEGEREDLVVALRVQYNLYNGNADSARRKQTAYLMEEAKSIRNNTRRQVIESLRLSWSSYQAITAQIAYLERNVAAARDTRDAYLKQFNIGRRTLLDLLNTENEVVEARGSLVNASYDLLFSRFRIETAMGQMLPVVKSSYEASAPSVVGKAEAVQPPAPTAPKAQTAVLTPKPVAQAAVASTKVAGEPKLEYQKTYAIQLAAFRDEARHARFLAEHKDLTLLCRRRDNGMHAIYFGVYDSAEAARAGLKEDSRIQANGGYIVTLRNVSFERCH